MPTTTFAIALPFPCAISCRSSAPLQMGSGWQLSNILNLESGEPMSFYDSSDDISFSGEILGPLGFFWKPERRPLDHRSRQTNDIFVRQR